jgi:hypothetical protein
MQQQEKQSPFLCTELPEGGTQERTVHKQPLEAESRRVERSRPAALQPRPVQYLHDQTRRTSAGFVQKLAAIRASWLNFKDERADARVF